MTVTLEDWHREAAEIAFGAYNLHAMRESLPAVERENAVTAWRATAHLVNDYANGNDGDTWAAFWAEAMSRDAFLRLIERRSRFNRCRADGDAPLYRDSVAAWERDLTTAITAGARYVRGAEAHGKEEPIRRLRLNLQVAMSLAAAYTGCSLDAIREALEASDGDPKHGGDPDAHPLHKLITDNRPTR